MMARKRKGPEPAKADTTQGTPMPEWLAASWKWIPGAPKLGSIEKCADLLIFMHHLNKKRSNKSREVKLGMNPKLLNALALDLLCASCIKDYQGPGSVPHFPGPLLHLLALALDLEALTKSDEPTEKPDPAVHGEGYVFVVPNDQFTLVNPKEEPPEDELTTSVGYAPGQWDYHKLLPGKHDPEARFIMLDAYDMDYDYATEAYANSKEARMKEGELLKALKEEEEYDIKRTTLSTWRRTNYGFPEDPSCPPPTDNAGHLRWPEQKRGYVIGQPELWPEYQELLEAARQRGSWTYQVILQELRKKHEP